MTAYQIYEDLMTKHKKWMLITKTSILFVCLSSIYNVQGVVGGNHIY